jgi:hypothetical protein
LGICNESCRCDHTIIACILIGDNFYISARSKQNSFLIATVNAITGEFKVLDISTRGMQVANFIDVGQSGIIMDVKIENGQQTYFWHLRDLKNTEKMV